MPVSSPPRSPPRKPRTRYLVQHPPTEKKIEYGKSSGRMVICCKFAFKLLDPKEQCTNCNVAYCLPCRDRLIKEAEGKVETECDDNKNKRRSSRKVKNNAEKKSVGVTIIGCEKGMCNKHTIADVEDFEVTEIGVGYDQATRREKEDEGWERVAANCWGCGGEF